MNFLLLSFLRVPTKTKTESAWIDGTDQGVSKNEHLSLYFLRVQGLKLRGLEMGLLLLHVHRVFYFDLVIFGDLILSNF